MYKRSHKFAFRELDDTFLVIPSNMKNVENKIIYYTLNEVGREVWKRLDGKKTLNDIEEELLAIYDIDRGRLLSDIRELLSDMEDKGVVVKASGSDG